MSKHTQSNGQRTNSKGGSFVSALCNVIGTLMLVAVIITYLPLTVPRFMGYEIYEVVSGSMEPSIPVGSVVYVRACDPVGLQVDDVIAFWSGDSTVTHRVVQNRAVTGELVTKGDANLREDIKTVEYDDVVGRVERHFPVIGHLMSLYASMIGKIYVLAFAACGAMLNILAGRIRERRREQLLKRLERETRDNG